MTTYPKIFAYGDKILDSKANAKDTINITSNISGDTIRFKPFIKTFNDNHNVSFSSESVFGRMDDLYSYQNTKRAISLAFDVPSYSEEEAVDNLIKISLLKKWLYPDYAGASAITISKAPLFRISYMNLIFNKGNSSGLLGVIDGFSFAPDLGEGSYIENGVVVPKSFNVSLNFKVVHEFLLRNNMDTEYAYNVKDFSNLANPSANFANGTSKKDAK